MVECLEVAQCTPALVGKVNYFLHFQMKDDLLLSVGECEERRKEAGAAPIEGSKAIRSRVKCNQNCESGLLHASEIAQLQLSARLMVLSACQTGQGEIRGEGLLGLSRAIIRAHVPCAVLTLWQVDDEATRLFMEQFYRTLITGTPVVAALWQAMVRMLRTEKWSHPQFWAPFFCSGLGSVVLESSTAQRAPLPSSS